MVDSRPLPSQPTTHLSAEPRLLGTPVRLSAGAALVRLPTSSAMVVDASGLVHGGFTFGLADYAAMLAVNDPHVVLGGAETRFLAPVRKGEVMEAEARVRAGRGRKRTVEVVVRVGDRRVMTGTFTCFVLDRPVLGAQ